MRLSVASEVIMVFKIRNLSVQIACVQCLNYNLFYDGIYPYIGGVMATARLDIRLDEEIKAKAPNQALLEAAKFTDESGIK